MSNVCQPSRTFFVGLAFAALAFPSLAAAEDITSSLRFELAPAPFGPADGGGDGDLVLDDGMAEGVFGVGLTTARQFLWFNRFTLPAGGIQLDEIQVLFPPGANMAIGNQIEIVVFVDADSDPTNGADLLTSLPATVQTLDGSFSVYPLVPPPLITMGEDLLIGVINRFTQSGVDSPTSPAALDVTASQGRSWFATWAGDPPAMLLLPADQQMGVIDDFTPGNWMIRGIASPAAAVHVPTLGDAGLAILVLLLAWASVRAIRSSV